MAHPEDCPQGVCDPQLNPMTRTRANVLALTLASSLAALALLPSAQADPVPSFAHLPSECSRDVQVQHQLWNEHSCDGCRGQVVVQVGLTNRVECRGDCAGNLFVQAGLENSIECGTGGRVAAARGPCPSQLPDGNFWCHAVGRALPGELCLTLDFCLW